MYHALPQAADCQPVEYDVRAGHEHQHGTDALDEAKGFSQGTHHSALEQGDADGQRHDHCPHAQAIEEKLPEGSPKSLLFFVLSIGRMHPTLLWMSFDSLI